MRQPSVAFARPGASYFHELIQLHLEGLCQLVEHSEAGSCRPVSRAPRAAVGYWITSSARPSSDGGIVRLSALAVLRLMTRSNLVGCSTGRSAGLAPLRILSI